MKKNTQSSESGHTSRQEERDFHLGRLFGLQSLIQSGIVFNHEANLELYPAILDLVFELAEKKDWLRESCAWTVATSAERWPAAKATEIAETTYTKLAESGFAKSGEGVGIWLMLQAHHPKAAAPADVWSKDSPLAKSNLTKLSKVLRDSGSNDDTETKTKGSWNPKLGFVWDFILRAYFSKDKAWAGIRHSKKHAVSEWSDFWRAVVDEGLFASTSSDERKYWGFLFFVKSLDHVTKPAELSVMFSKNLMRCLMNQLADAERYLHKIATKSLRNLITKVEATPWMSPVVFKQLVSEHGTPNFDQLTKTKTVDKVIFPADINGLNEIFDSLKEVIMNPLTADDEGSAKVAEGRRQWAADHILAVIRNGKAIKPENWLRKVVELFTALGYYDIVEEERKAKPDITQATQTMFRTRLMSVLTQLIGHKGGKMANGESWPFLAVRSLQNLDRESRYKCVIEFDPTIEAEVDAAMHTVAQIRGNRSSKAGSKIDTQLLSFELLYSLIILQVYNGESDALSVLEDLKSIQDKILASAEKKPKKKKSDDSEDEEDVDASEVLVDILLSFLSRQSILLKRVAHTVFVAFAPFITPAGLDRCFDVLNASESMGGQQELFDVDNDDDDDEEDVPSCDDDELDSDVEMIDNGEEGAEDDSEIEIMSDSDEEFEETDETRKLEEALRTVLQPRDDDANSDSDEDMTDEAMLAMDEKINQIFKQRKEANSKKTEKKDAKELIIAFKSKVLEVLEIFVKTLPTSPVALEVLLPCLTLARKTRDQKLADKANAVIRTFSHALKRAEDTNDEVEISTAVDERTWEIMASIHEEAARGGNPSRKAACSSASIIVAKTLLRRAQDNLEKISDAYSKSLTQWAFSANSGLENSFFTDFVGWIGSIRQGLKKKAQEDNKKATLEVREDKAEEEQEVDDEEEEVVVEKKEKKSKKNKSGKQNDGKRKREGAENNVSADHEENTESRKKKKKKGSKK